jgi:DNA repair exonuclease SbcCD ATPase subunit
VSDLFLESVRFKDFRTFGVFALDVVPAPGLTLLVGTNGLGKSGFFDALEWGLTGQVRRFKAYLPSADEAKYLTRRTAPAGSHEVSLGFTGEKQLRRTGRAGPSPDAVVAMLKRPGWGAQIHDIGTYLAFTHFLGQAAQQRFTSRAKGEQWESLKGPSGIERLEEVRNGLRGRATQRAFTRRIRREADTVAELTRQLTEWRGWRLRLTRLRDAASAAGALPDAELAKRLDALTSQVAALTPALAQTPADASPSQQLTILREAIDAARAEIVPSRVVLESLNELPDRYAEQRAGANPAASALVSARTQAERERVAVDEAAAKAAVAREQLEATAAAVTALETEAATLELIRQDLEGADAAQLEMNRLDAERPGVEAALERQRQDLAALERELQAAQARTAELAGLEATTAAAATLAELARQLPGLQDRAVASAAAAAEAADGAAAARQALERLAADSDRLRSNLDGARSTLDAARARASAVAAAVAQIASHLHDEDIDCPVCRSHFPPGALRLVAQQASAVQSAELTLADAAHARLTAQLAETKQAIAVAQATVARAEDARRLAEAEDAAFRRVEQRVRAALPTGAGDILASAIAAERDAAAAFGLASARAAADEPRRAEASARRDAVHAELPRLEDRFAELQSRARATEAARRTRLERIAAAGYAHSSLEDVAATLRARQASLSRAQADRRDLDAAAQAAAAAELSAHQRAQVMEQEAARLAAAQVAATETVAALEARWRDAGLDGVPSAAGLAAAVAALTGRATDIERLENERNQLAGANEVAVRDQELRDLLREMAKAGGPSAADDPDRREAELVDAVEQAAQAQKWSEEARAAVQAFSDKLRDEADRFSTQFLAPLNTLIDDFNEALLSTPGESVRFNADHHVDTTRFDMSLRFRDPLEDAMYDTDLPPQVVLSEGQLAANGFSILCAASTAYPWSRWRSLLLDDPLQHNDIIHAAAFVDLMRNLVELEGYQLIMSSHDRAEGEFIARKFEAAGLPCSVVALTAPSRAGVRYEPPKHNAAALTVLRQASAQSA